MTCLEILISKLSLLILNVFLVYLIECFIGRSGQQAVSRSTQSLFPMHARITVNNKSKLAV